MKVFLLAHTGLHHPYTPINGLTEVDSVMAHVVAQCDVTEPSAMAIREHLESDRSSALEHINFTFQVKKGVSHGGIDFIFPPTEIDLIITINARSLFNLFTLSRDHFIEQESRELISQMYEIVQELAPVTFSVTKSRRVRYKTAEGWKKAKQPGLF